MTTIPLQNQTPIPEQLCAFGFVETDGSYRYSADLLNGQMHMTVSIDSAGTLRTEVTDSETGDVYVLHHIPDATGAFVGQVREAHDSLLQTILERCFALDFYKSSDTKAVISYVRTQYGDELEHLWAKTPTNAVWRRKDNAKWYGVLLVIPKNKLGLDGDEMVEILDLRMAPDELTTVVDNHRYFPGYHMNKRHWVTICLDGSLPVAEICRRIDASYQLANKK